LLVSLEAITIFMTGPQGIHGTFTTFGYPDGRSAGLLLIETSRTTDFAEGSQ
jgi:hypothetical protein